MRQRPGSSPAVRLGLVFGGLIILVSIIDSVTELLVVRGGVSSGMVNSGVGLGFGAIVYLADLALLFLAGMFTARQNGKVGSATIAGLIAGAIGGPLGTIITFIITFVGWIPPTTPPSGFDIMDTTLLIGGVFVATFALLFYAGFGAGAGAIGGLIGKTSYQSRHPVPGYPYRGAYPPPGGYPPPPQPYPQQPPQYPPEQPSQQPPQSPLP